MNKKIDFILSTGRTGTVAISKVLNTAEKTTCLHEPRNTRRFKVLGNYYFNKNIPDWAEKYFLSAKANDWNSIKGNHHIEVNPMLWHWTNIITTQYPDAKIIHMVRNARTWLLSIINHYVTIKGYLRLNAIPYWEPHISISGNTKFTSDPILNNKIEKWLLIWELKNKFIEENCNPENYMLLRFEDVFTNNKTLRTKTLSEISTFLNITINPDKASEFLAKKHNATKRTKYNSETILNSNLDNYLAMHPISSFLKKYGYDI